MSHKPLLSFLSLFLIGALLLASPLGTSTRAAPQAEALVKATEDVYIDGSTAASSLTNWDGGALFAANSVGSSNQIILLKFTDLKTIGVTVTKAKLAMAIVKGCNLAPIGIDSGIDVYAINDDSWSEGTVVWSSSPTPPLTAPPARGAHLASSDQTTITATNNEVTWTDNTVADGLAQFLAAEQAGDGIASLWVEISTTDSAAAQIVFEDTERGGFNADCAGAGIIVPTLRLADSDLPTAVTVRSFRAAGGAGIPLIWAGLVLPLAAAVGLVLYRRRKPGA